MSPPSSTLVAPSPKKSPRFCVLPSTESLMPPTQYGDPPAVVPGRLAKLQNWPGRLATGWFSTATGASSSQTVSMLVSPVMVSTQVAL